VWLTYSVSLPYENGKFFGCNETELYAVTEGMFFLTTQYFRTDMNMTISGLVGSLDFRTKSLSYIFLQPYIYGL
jgi:hypothetical protein